AELPAGGSAADLDAEAACGGLDELAADVQAAVGADAQGAAVREIARRGQAGTAAEAECAAAGGQAGKTRDARPRAIDGQAGRVAGDGRPGGDLQCRAARGLPRPGRQAAAGGLGQRLAVEEQGARLRQDDAAVAQAAIDEQVRGPRAGGLG